MANYQKFNIFFVFVFNLILYFFNNLANFDNKINNKSDLI